MKLYMKVTKDEYQLPLAVADSAQELAAMVGASTNTVQSCISKKYPQWIRVVIDDVEEEDPWK